MKEVEYFQTTLCQGLKLTQGGFRRNQQVVAEMNKMAKAGRGGFAHIGEPLEELFGRCFMNSEMFDSLPLEEENS